MAARRAHDAIARLMARAVLTTWTVKSVKNNNNPSIIEFIHDVGAGGLSNAIPELAKDSELGVYINLSCCLHISTTSLSYARLDT